MPVVDHQDAVGELHHEVHVVLDDEQRQAVVAQRRQAREQHVDLGGVEPRGRLVDKEEPRLGRERARDFEHALLAIGQRARYHLRALGKAHEGEQVHRLVAATVVVAPERGAVQEVLPGRDVVTQMKSGDDVRERREMPEQPDFLECAGDPVADAPMGAQMREIGPVEGDRAGSRAGRRRSAD